MRFFSLFVRCCFSFCTKLSSWRHRAVTDTEGAKAVRQKLAAQNKQLKAYCEDNGMEYRSDRVRTYGAIEPSTVRISYISVRRKTPLDAI